MKKLWRIVQIVLVIKNMLTKTKWLLIIKKYSFSSFFCQRFCFNINQKLYHVLLAKIQVLAKEQVFSRLNDFFTIMALSFWAIQIIRTPILIDTSSISSCVLSKGQFHQRFSRVFFRTNVISAAFFLTYVRNVRT